jgi:carboxypeptidase family protein
MVLRWLDMKRITSALLVLGILLACQPVRLAAFTQNPGEIAGIAVVEGKPLAAITVRLRNVDSGQLVGTTTTNDRGEFRFTGLPVGNYVVETVARNGSTLLGTSPRIALVTGAMLATGVTVSTSAAAAAAAGLTAGAAGGAAGAGAAGTGAAGAGSAAGGTGAAVGASAAGASFFATTAGIVTVVAVGAGLAAVVAVRANASPSR